MIWKIVGWFASLPFKRALATIDAVTENETERQRIRADVIKHGMEQRVSMAGFLGPWFMAVFVFPLGLHWASVNLYSIFWCADCAYPQSWTIAALPPPMDEWSGWIVMGIFMAEGIKRVWR